MRMLVGLLTRRVSRSTFSVPVKSPKSPHWGPRRWGPRPSSGGCKNPNPWRLARSCPLIKQFSTSSYLSEKPTEFLQSSIPCFPCSGNS